MQARKQDKGLPMKTLLRGVTLFSFVWVLSTVANAQEPGKLVNPSFEESDGGKVVGWNPQTWNGKPLFDRPESAHGGTRSVMISSESGADAAWKAAVVVKPFSQYRLKGFAKTENVAVQQGKGALINVPTGVGHEAKDNTTAVLTGTQDWTPVEVLFDTGATDAVEIHLLLGGWGLASGRVWFDDLALELVSSRELHPAVTLKGKDVGHDISPYIYGQFIEHLGRCIYGGIWAEMLEDRKFFFKCGEKESPWRIYTGIQRESARTHAAIVGRVEMTTADAYAGAQSAAVTLKGTGAFGISQGELAVRAGKKYVGRVILRGEPAAAPIDVTLIYPGASDKSLTVTFTELTAEYKAYPFEFAPAQDSDGAMLAISGRGKGKFQIGCVSLMPADNIEGMRADTIALLKELASPIYRWPGGNFVSGYNWRDGIGERDKRPPRKNPAWKGVEHNDFGLDEFMAFCRIVGTEAYITVNSGQGDTQSAADELQYANGTADTPMGQLRAKNGHAEPYGVKWWAIGNEMYGDWQLGHMPLSDYVKKNNAFADAMRAIDPSIKLVAVGATGEWSKTMLAECSGHMELLSEHFYCQEKPGLMSHVRQIPDNVRAKADAHRQYHKEIAALANKTIPIALDEWNFWYGPELYGQIGTRYFLKDALGIAAGLHEYSRNSDIFMMANYAQTVNVIGAIKTSKTAAAFETTGLVLKLYRNHFGTSPINLDGNAAPLDVAAAWTADHKKVTIGIVNPTAEARVLKLNTADLKLHGPARAWTIAGPDPMAFNTPEAPAGVAIQESTVKDYAEGLPAPAIGVVLYEIEAAE
jgi:alpha-N-arabinofuranosidase